MAYQINIVIHLSPIIFKFLNLQIFKLNITRLFYHFMNKQNTALLFPVHAVFQLSIINQTKFSLMKNLNTFVFNFF